MSGGGGRNVDHRHTHFQSSVNALVNRKSVKGSLVTGPSMSSVCVCQCFKRITLIEIHACIVSQYVVEVECFVA